MKKIFLVLGLSLVFGVLSHAQTNKIVGKWKVVDEKDGTPKCIVNIYQSSNGKYYGKVEKLLDEPEKICPNCIDKNKISEGKLVISNLKDSNNVLSGGTILDFNDGKIYKCKITYDSRNSSIVLRASLDKRGVFGRSLTWTAASDSVTVVAQ